MRTHPILLATPAGVELARTRIGQEKWAKDIADRLVARTDKLAKEELPVFETAWWKDASKKHWNEIYPEINKHTMFAVVEPMQKAADAATAYAVTGNKAYADTARRVLLHYTEYSFFAEHPDVGLNWSIWCLRALQAYDFIYSTLDDTDRMKLDDFFKRAMEAVMKNDKWWISENPGGRFNNHFAWHKTFIGSYGLFYDRRDLIDYAMNSTEGIRELIEHGSMDDGLWFESSINYHFTAANALAVFASELSNAGSPIDLWHSRFANGRTLKDLFMGPIQTLFADETIPTIGDTYGHRVKLGDNGTYFAAFDACGSPEMAWVIRNSPRPAQALFLAKLPDQSSTPPSMKTRLWPEHGYIALRSQEGADYWRGEGYSAFFSFDLDNVHCHHDKFDLMVFGRGAHLAVDPETLSSAKHAFSSDIQAELNRSTVCHNTVMVDRKDHAHVSRKLDLLDYVDGSDTKLATVADTRGLVYPGVKMMRTVAVTSDYVLDIFQVHSDEEHTYDYLLHTYDDRGSLQTTESLNPVHLGDAAPWKWLKNAGVRREDDNWQVTAKQGSLVTRLMMLGAPETKLITCQFPRKDDFEGVPVPMLIARRHAKSTVFVALLQAERDELPVTLVSLGRAATGFIDVKVNSEGRERTFTVRALH